MTRDLQRRVGALEGGGSGVRIGELMDLMNREDVGEVIDWDTIKLDPVLARALDNLPD